MKVPGLFYNAKTFRDVPAGTVIFEEGASGTEMFGVVEGEVEVRLPNGAVRRLGPNDTFGEMAIIDSSPRSGTAVAVTDTKLAVIDRSKFLFLVQETPMFALQVMSSIARRLRAAETSLRPLPSTELRGGPRDRAAPGVRAAGCGARAVRGLSRRRPGRSRLSWPGRAGGAGHPGVPARRGGQFPAGRRVRAPGPHRHQRGRHGGLLAGRANRSCVNRRSRQAGEPSTRDVRAYGGVAAPSGGRPPGDAGTDEQAWGWLTLRTVRIPWRQGALKIADSVASVQTTSVAC